MTRAHLAATGFTDAQVIHGDFLHLRLPRHRGRTAFVGNPPYVRHHRLHAKTKSFAKEAGERLGVRVSGLAGLHALFVLTAALNTGPEDLGCFITSAEWLDVRYGEALRQLFKDRLGIVRLDLLGPRAIAFNDAMTTAAIVSWEAGYSGPVSVRQVKGPKNFEALCGGRVVSRTRLSSTSRWSDLLVSTRAPDDLVPLGSFARVHRGVATGANDFFVLPRDRAHQLGLEAYVRPCLVRAREVISGGA